MHRLACNLLLWFLVIAPIFAFSSAEERDSILQLYSIDLKLLEGAGDSMFWDFSQAKLSKHPSRLHLLVDSLGMPSAIFSGTRYQLDSHSDTLLLRGIEDKYRHISYSQGPVLMTIPLCYGNTMTGTFWGKGMYCDRLGLDFSGHYTMKVDARGLLVTPNSDTLCSIRVHVQIISDALLSPNNASENNLRQVKFVEDMYSWYPLGSSIPIIVARTVSTDRQHILVNRAWYICRENSCRIVQQENLVGFERVQQAEDTISSLQLPIDYQISIDFSGRKVTVSYTLANDGHVEFVLSDAFGIIYQKYNADIQRGITASQQINCQSMLPGQYILNIIVAGHRYAEKFLIE